jgi:hypothetical protein
MARLDPRCNEREHLRPRWPDDSGAPLILRAASVANVRTYGESKYQGLALSHRD